jgi:hypothetical protein
VFLFPSHPLRPKEPDPSFEAEVQAAHTAGFGMLGYVELDLHLGGSVKLHQVPICSDGKGYVTYRGWILKTEQLVALQKALASRGWLLSPTLEEYLQCYHFPRWYQAIGEGERTPDSIWFPNGFNFDLSHVSGIARDHFGDKPLIVKDYIKSQKHHWFESCFIASAADEENLRHVVSNFIHMQAGDMVGGLVLREFIKFKQIGIHSKSRMPLVNEHRFFVFRGAVFYQAPYWAEGDYSGNVPSEEVVRPILPLVKSPFFAVDVAERENGEWTIVELNDGSSAGIPEGGTPEGFYRALCGLLV